MKFEIMDRAVRVIAVVLCSVILSQVAATEGMAQGRLFANSELRPHVGIPQSLRPTAPDPAGRRGISQAITGPRSSLAWTEAATTASTQNINSASEIPYWSGQYTAQGVTYPFNMIGTDPNKGSAATTIPTVIIPLRFVLADGAVYDSSTELVDGQTPVQGIINSPIFQSYDFTIGGTNVGFTQFGDAYMRAAFWSAVSTTSPDYHVLLEQPTVAPVQTINVPDGEFYYYHDQSSNVIIPVITMPYDGRLFETMLADLNVSPRALPIIVAGPVFFVAAGFHDAFLTPSGNAIGGRTYIYTDYSPKDLQGDIGLGDISTLSHEIVEWLSDPFILNSTPGWNMPFLQTPGCSSQSFNDLLEVSDTLALSFPDSGIRLPGAVQTYHVQDSVFLDFFTRQSPSRSVNGYYSMFNVQQAPSTPCVGHLEFTYTYFAYPGSRWTEGFGINNRDQIVGYYQDPTDNRDHGYIFDKGLFQTIDYPGAYLTYPSNINDSGLIAGYYVDVSGVGHGFSYFRGAYTSIDFPGAIDTFAQGVNAQGDIVGGYDDADLVTHGFILHAGRFESVESPLGPGAQLTSVDARGRLTGYTAAGAATGELGFVRTNIGFLSTNFPDTIQTQPLSLNSSNVLSGLFFNAPICECLASWSGFVTIGDFRNNRYRYIKGYTYGSNDKGEIVGSDYRSAFVARLPK